MRCDAQEDIHVHREPGPAGKLLILCGVPGTECLLNQSLGSTDPHNNLLTTIDVGDVETSVSHFGADLQSHLGIDAGVPAFQVGAGGAA